MSATAFVSMTNVDGVITPTAEARVPVMDRGFLFGDSIYEVFRSYEGVPLFYAEHWARFENSAALIHLDLQLSAQALLDLIRTTVAATGAARLRQDVYVRYIVTRGEGAMDLFPEPFLPQRFVIIVRPVPRWNPDFYSRGMTLAVPDTRRNPMNALDPNIQGGNYLNNVLGLMEARALGADDCIMLNNAGYLTEASNSNVFFVIDGVAVTPSDRAGNLRGLTKAALHAACAAQGRQQTEERDLTLADLGAATECFVTSATREVMPVVRLQLPDGEALNFPAGGGAVTQHIAALYRDYVTAYIRDHAALSIF
jgi:branched-chain amino acid aminotransferase